MNKTIYNPLFSDVKNKNKTKTLLTNMLHIKNSNKKKTNATKSRKMPTAKKYT